MISVRNAIVSATLLLILAIGASLLSMVQPPDSGGQGADSYGTKGHGYKALYDTLDELDVDVTRGLAPPDAFSGTTVIAFFRPSAFIAATEPAYIEDLRQWVENGGRIVVAPSSEDSFARDLVRMQLDGEPRTVLDSLGLEGIVVTDQMGRAEEIEQAKRYVEADADTMVGELMRHLTVSSVTPESLDVTVEGDFPGLSDQLRQLAVPQHQKLALTCPETPEGTISSLDSNGSPRIHVARFKRGKGDVIVLSEALLLSNCLLAEADNSLLAMGTLSPGGAPVRFDEFYHGLGVRGQPLYLLTRLNYATVTLCLLLLIGLLTWRRAVFPGPPLQDDQHPRRDIREYVSAMARFFSEGGQGHGRLIEELRNGVVRQTCLEFGLPPDTTDIDRVTAAVARKDMPRSQQLSDALSFVDSQLQSRRRWSESQTLNAMQRISKCL